MLKKLVIVYNPQASHHGAIEREVLAPARKLGGWLVGKYEVKKADFETNARGLARMLRDGDLVIAAGGDGTAAVAANGIMQSGKDVTLGVLGYGDFNDMARMLGAKRAVEYGGEYIGGVSEIVAKFEAGKTKEMYPLKVKVNGKHWRFAPCYFGVGMFAESTGVFDEEKVRKKLQTGKKGLGFSILQLAKWYFRHRREEFLPAGEIVTGAREGEIEEKRGEKTEKTEGVEKAEKVEKVVEEREEAVRDEGADEAGLETAKAQDEAETAKKAAEAEKRAEQVAAEAAKKAEKAKLAAERREKAREEKERRKMAVREKRRQNRAKMAKLGQKVEKMGHKTGEVAEKSRKKLGEMLQKGRKKLGKITKKAARGAKNIAREIQGRSKARMMDIKVQAQARRAEKQEWERMNQPEIQIDTEMTRRTERVEPENKQKEEHGEA